jgi:hypothetical protein
MDRVYRYPADFGDCVAAIHSGARVEIDHEMYMYWLEVLPPVYMRRVVTLPGDGKRVTAFGFAEGCERITAFWSEGSGDAARFFCQRTEQWHNG